MAEIKKAKNLGEWLDMRLGTNKLVKVLMTEYWI
ncbi:ubiquinol cytochrome c oxidoreductase, cytochrome b subunit fbcH, partial [Rhodococcus opacus PD630]